MHELKIYPRFFRAIRNGRKTWEYRKEDGKPFFVGQKLLLRVVGEKSKKPTGQTLTCRVTYIHRGWPIPDGFVCMSIVVLQAVLGDPRRGSAELPDELAPTPGRVRGLGCDDIVRAAHS